MKTLKIVLVVILAAVVINLIRGGEDFPLPHTLPLSGGFRPGVYDLGALGMVLLCIWGLVRLKRFGRPRDASDTARSSFGGYEEADDDEDIDDFDIDDGDE